MLFFSLMRLEPRLLFMPMLTVLKVLIFFLSLLPTVTVPFLLLPFLFWQFFRLKVPVFPNNPNLLCLIHVESCGSHLKLYLCLLLLSWWWFFCCCGCGLILVLVMMVNVVCFYSAASTVTTTATSTASDAYG